MDRIDLWLRWIYTGGFQIIARLKYIQSITLSAIINDNFDSYFKILVDKFQIMITD